MMEATLKSTETRLLRATLLVGLIVGMAACKSTEDQQASGSSPTQAAELETPTVEMPMNLNGQLEFSIKDLAKRLDVSPESIKVSGARMVTWRSGALGCPEPGMNYTQALVPGSVIYLQVDNVIHAYHGKIGSEPFYCPRERVEQPVLDKSLDPT